MVEGSIRARTAEKIKTAPLETRRSAPQSEGQLEANDEIMRGTHEMSNIDEASVESIIKVKETHNVDTDEEMLSDKVSSSILVGDSSTRIT